jgi:hypothetical protein
LRWDFPLYLSVLWGIPPPSLLWWDIPTVFISVYF